MLPPLRPGALDELLERYINNDHPLSRQSRPARSGSLRVLETRLAWTNGPLPATPADVILRHLADEETLTSHPALNHRSVVWEFRRHRLFLFSVHLRQAWREVGRAVGDWRREAFEAGDWSRAGDGVRLLGRALRGSLGLSMIAIWTIGLGRDLPCPQKQIQRWAGSLAGTRLRLVTRSAAA